MKNYYLLPDAGQSNDMWIEQNSKTKQILLKVYGGSEGCLTSIWTTKDRCIKDLEDLITYLKKYGE